MKDISYAALMAALAFLVIPIWASYRQRLGISKEIAVSSLRAWIQLTIIGYVITVIFSIETWYLLVLIILLMILIAGWSSARRGKRFSNAFGISVAAISAAVVTSVSIWLGFGVIRFNAQYILPMSGMVIGNAMLVVSLTFERMWNEFELTKDLILGKLALGANPRQSCQDLIEATVKAAMIPNVEVLKTTGLIQLPGMMTGAIIAGASPIVAVKYQLVILLTLMSNASMTAILVSLLAYRTFFRRKMF